MIKRLLLVCLFAGLVFPGFVSAEDSQKNTAGDGAQIFTGRAEYGNLRMCLDFVVDVMAGLDLKLNSVRVSPMIKSEQWYGMPMEFGWLGTEDTLAPLFEKMLAYSFAESRLSHDAINISVSAETRDNQPILSVTSQERLMCFDKAENKLKENSSELLKAIYKHNQKTIRALRALLKTTTFTPQVGKKIQGNETGQGKTWLTNLRLDSDNRLNLTGYGLDAKEVTRLGEELLDSGSFTEVYLHSMTKNVYEKVPVWRFDFTAKAN
ncbi:MAG TPA: PilN domain-containing protein [Candidatus Rifleibacterium sp.]|nr:PilN domain-containing protein [Candidatus Rifleibacterium sp.]HPT46386.1 PilN domain-containing protein [Candidatus Rifleibacterium sp.]